MKIAIVGAGPAGLACACQLEQYGHDVSIFERMPDLSAQGSGVLIQPVGLEALDILGLRGSTETLGRKIRRISGYSIPSNRATVTVDYRVLKKVNYAIAVDRTALWNLLLSKARAHGLEVQAGISIETIKRYADGTVAIIDQHEQDYGPFDLVVDSSGAHSKLSALAYHPVKSKRLDYGSLWARVNCNDDSPYNKDVMTLYSDCKNIGMGALPMGRLSGKSPDTMTLFFNLKWQDWNANNFDSWKKSVIAQLPSMQSLIEQIRHPNQLYLAKFMQHTLSKPYGDRVVYIGDSAHASNPQLGQGINMSLVDAVCLPWALEQDGDFEKGLRLYATMRRNHVLFYQTLSRLLSPFYQSDVRPAIELRELFYPSLSLLRIMKLATAHLISGQISDPLKKLRS